MHNENMLLVNSTALPFKSRLACLAAFAFSDLLF